MNILPPPSRESGRRLGNAMLRPVLEAKFCEAVSKAIDSKDDSRECQKWIKLGRMYRRIMRDIEAADQ
jgi:hypothetical protein